jgi:hypothetical protein
MAGETSGDGQSLKIRNVGVLDMRKATEETVSRHTEFENVGVLVYSAESRRLLAGTRMTNVGMAIEAPSSARLVQGALTVSAAFLSERSTPLDLAVTGQLIVGADVGAKELDSGLGELVVAGEIVCPEALEGLLQSKLRRHTGATWTYRAGADTRLVTRKLTLDEAFLRSLPDGSRVVALRAVEAPDILPSELLAQKIGALEARRSVRCRGENAEAIRAVLAGSRRPSVRVVPIGFEPVDRPLRLDRRTLRALPGTRLCCSETVVVADEVSEENLSNGVEGLVAEDLLICPARLQGVMVTICNLVETTAIFYEGELWRIDGEETLRQSRFDFLNGSATMLVTGVLQIEPGVEAATLFERVAAVHNFGVIMCTPDQASALQARLVTNEGEIAASTEGSDGREVEGSPGMQNIGVLTL